MTPQRAVDELYIGVVLGNSSTATGSSDPRGMST